MKSRIHLGAIIFLLSALLATTYSYAQNKSGCGEEIRRNELETLWQAADMPRAPRTKPQDAFVDLLNSISTFRSDGSIKTNEEPQDKTGVFDESYWDNSVYR